METLKNLIKAYVGECQARNRYTFYAKIAKKQGYEQIAGIFLETAEQEKTHAKRLFEHIQELKKDTGDTEKINVEVTAPITYGTTKENIQAAINGEHYETSEMYPEFADIAEKEGFEKISKRLRAIAKAEEHHEERYKKLLDNIEKNSIFKKEKEVIWVCRECGYIHVGKEPPEKCPSCDHPRAYYELKCENF